MRGRLIPTSEAHALFAQIDQVFDRVEGVRRTIGNLREARSGTLSIVAIPAVGATLVPAAIGEFKAKRPEVSIRDDGVRDGAGSRPRRRSRST